MKDSKTKNKNADLHAKHRQRMLKKFRRYGKDRFSPHELFEMLLYFSIPRSNTNDTAHLAINKFGSMRRALYAPLDELMEVSGIGEKSATLIKVAEAAFNEAELEEMRTVPLENEFLQSTFLHTWYKDKGPGVVMALMLDAKMTVKDEFVVASGRRTRRENYPEVILDAAKKANCKYVILSHNHRDNIKTPSIEDIYLTGAVRSALGKEGIELVSHYIITEFDVTPVTKANF